MLKLIVTFGLGVYSGIYLEQNYKLPQVTDPQALYKRAKDYLDSIAKPKNDK